MEDMQQTNETQQTISVGEWLVTFILTAIPILNLIVLLLWAFTGGTHPSKANWAKAVLLMMVIVGFLWIGFLMTMDSLYS